MASKTLQVGGIYADGTVLGAYPASAWSGQFAEGAPRGAATDTDTVTDASVTFTGLANGTDYYVTKVPTAAIQASYAIPSDDTGTAVILEVEAAGAAGNDYSFEVDASGFLILYDAEDTEVENSDPTDITADGALATWVAANSAILVTTAADGGAITEFADTGVFSFTGGADEGEGDSYRYVSFVTGVVSGAKGFVLHDADDAVARPDYISVEWVGSVEPTNAEDGDTWIDGATITVKDGTFA